MKKIPTEQVFARLSLENKWWQSSQIAPAWHHMNPRACLDLFYPLVASTTLRRAIVLMGPRRVGKTVLLHHTIQKLLDSGIEPRRIALFSVDHPIYNGLALEEFLKMYGEATGTDIFTEECFLFFDEIQYLKGWEQHLKSLVDSFPNLKCTVSGSAAAALKLQSRESGAGRFTDFLLPPLTFHEYLLLLGKDDLVLPPQQGELFTTPDIDELNRNFVHYLNFGGYPEVIFSEEIQADPTRFVKNDIIDKVLLRDLPSLYGVQDIQELNSLFTTLAFNTAGEVSFEELSKGSGVAKNTIKKYLEYLQATFLVRAVQRVDQNAKRFKRTINFKIYLTNPSMRSALFTPITGDDPTMGSLAETAVFAQWFHSTAHLFYARWKGGEVDIVSRGDDQQVRWILEVTWSDRFFQKSSELKNLFRFCHANNLNSATVTTKTTTGESLKESVRVQVYAYQSLLLYGGI